MMTMNIMKLRTWWIHFKIQLGDKKFDKTGYKIIPCYHCDKMFKSYQTYHGSSLAYYFICNECIKKKRADYDRNNRTRKK